MSEPKILLFDIETAPMVVTSWDLWRPRLSHENIQQESSLISAAWKWLDEKRVDEVHVNPRRPNDDRQVVSRLHSVLEGAHILVGHNVDRFDLRKLNARAIKHGLPPLPRIQTIDTLKVARSVFAFNSNRLDYLGKFLCGTGKIPTTYGLWLKVMEGNRGALSAMVKYNKADVLLLEKVYKKLRPHIKNHPNLGVISGAWCCPNCGSGDIWSCGYNFSRITKRKRYQCKQCYAKFSGEIVQRAKVTA